MPRAARNAMTSIATPQNSRPCRARAATPNLMPWPRWPTSDRGRAAGGFLRAAGFLAGARFAGGRRVAVTVAPKVTAASQQTAESANVEDFLGTDPNKSSKFGAGGAQT